MKGVEGDTQGPIRLLLENSQQQIESVEAVSTDQLSLELLNKVKRCKASVYVEMDCNGILAAYMYKTTPLARAEVMYNNCGLYWYFSYRATSIRMRIDSSVLQHARNTVNVPIKTGDILFAYNENLLVKRVYRLSQKVLSSHSLIEFSNDLNLKDFGPNEGRRVDENTAKEILRWVYSTDCCLSGADSVNCIPWRSFPSGCDARAIVVAHRLRGLNYSCAIVKLKTNDSTRCAIIYRHTEFDLRVNYPLHYVAAIRYNPARACSRQDSFLILDPLTIPLNDGGTNLEDYLKDISMFNTTNWKNRFTHECNCVKRPGERLEICPSPGFSCFEEGTGNVSGTLSSSRSRLRTICACYPEMPKYLY